MEFNFIFVNKLGVLFWFHWFWEQSVRIVDGAICWLEIVMVSAGEIWGFNFVIWQAFVVVFSTASFLGNIDEICLGCHILRKVHISWVKIRTFFHSHRRFVGPLLIVIHILCEFLRLVHLPALVVKSTPLWRNLKVAAFLFIFLKAHDLFGTHVSSKSWRNWVFRAHYRFGRLNSCMKL